MKASALLPTKAPSTPNRVPDTPAEVVTVRPVRAAFGPAVSLVSVVDHGRLWMRFSTAMSLMLAGVALMLIPVLALWWVGGGLVESGQVSFGGKQDTSSVVTDDGTGGPVSGNPTELPLADTKDGG